MIVWLYLLLYLTGTVVGILSPADFLAKGLQILEPVILTALIASFLVPFAALAKAERWQKFALQWALIPLFGLFSVELWRQSGLVGIFGLFLVSAVHLAYWTSGIHSREYRFRQFEAGFRHAHHDLLRQVALFNATGDSGQADELIRQFLAAQHKE